LLTLALDYLGFAFFANIGVLQLAGIYNRSLGISFFRRNIFNYIFSFFTIVPPLFIFFIWNNIHEIGIIEGAQQAYLFFSSFILALFLTLVVRSFRRYREAEYEQRQTDLFLKLKSYLQPDKISRDKKK
jgi:hypothetical protein